MTARESTAISACSALKRRIFCPNCHLSVLALVASVLCTGGRVAAAQSATEPLPGRYEAAVGVSWMGPTSYGSLDASLTPASGARYRLFSTSTELAAAPAFEVRLGRRLTRVIQVDLALGYASPMLTTSISNDAENGAATVASEPMRQISLVAAVVVYVPQWRAGSGVLPFVTGGGGYLRELHEGSTLLQTGGIYHVGAGVMIPLVSRERAGGVKQFGIRADGHLLFRTGGVAMDGVAHTTPALAASVFSRF